MSNGESIATVKNWHVILVLVSWLVIGVMGYADLRAQSNENERRIQTLESRPGVTLDQYQDGQHALERRLDRIETKVDDLESRHR